MMQNETVVKELRSQSTWRLLGLALLTLGVYYGHYMTRQTRIINKHLPEDRKIPPNFVLTILVLGYLTLGLFVGYLFVPEDHPVAVVSDTLDWVWLLMMLFWGFYARSRMNLLTGAERGGPLWFSGLWTLLLNPFYFNYKINRLNETGAVQGISA